ncbi:phosphohistidine phosphatase SixA [Marinobacter sp.]|uniref:phosphohistidine phosphatase SixA n=1 Tax=Marinobacter sp. TaxID=50741 RepID=UPI002B27BB15|nr:phosphohistidine phosphatase SixA [Marinobacter sp.]
MQLIIMRHGEAGRHSLDHERELTEVGRKQAVIVAEQIANSDSKPSLIWYSPYIRARQTAAIVADILGCPMQEKSFITPDDDPGRCLDALLENKESPLMLVSHMPLVGSLTTLLSDGHRNGMPFLTAQAVMLDMPVAGPDCAILKTQFVP